jgi:hypothetical protein
LYASGAAADADRLAIPTKGEAYSLDITLLLITSSWRELVEKENSPVPGSQGARESRDSLSSESPLSHFSLFLEVSHDSLPRDFLHGF